jgi:hypothetical protein
VVKLENSVTLQCRVCKMYCTIEHGSLRRDYYCAWCGRGRVQKVEPSEGRLSSRFLSPIEGELIINKAKAELKNQIIREIENQISLQPVEVKTVLNQLRNEVNNLYRVSKTTGYFKDL